MVTRSIVALIPAGVLHPPSGGLDLKAFLGLVSLRRDDGRGDTERVKGAVIVPAGVALIGAQLGHAVARPPGARDQRGQRVASWLVARSA